MGAQSSKAKRKAAASGRSLLLLFMGAGGKPARGRREARAAAELPRPADRRVEGGRERVGRQALVDVVLGAELEGEGLVLLLVDGRAVEDDRRGGHDGIGAEGLGELESVEAGHPDV